VSTILWLAASSDDHCIGSHRSANDSPTSYCEDGTRKKVSLIQRSLASGLSVVGKPTEDETKRPALGVAATLVSELEIGTQRVVQDPEGEVSKVNKRAFIVISGLILVGVGCWIKKLVNDHVAASAVISLPWYTDSKILLEVSFLMLSTWFSLGLTAFTQVILFNDPPKHLTFIEGCYLSSQIVTTVGYGDFIPAYPEGQVFLACYILVGVSFVAILIGVILDRAANTTFGSDAPAEEEPAHLDEGDADADKPCSNLATPFISEASDGVERGLSSRVVDVPSGYIGQPHHTGIASKALAPGQYRSDQPRPRMSALARSMIIMCMCCAAGTLFFRFYPGENKSIWMAFYMSCVTLTSVGFGGVHPVTQGGYLFATFWMIIGVSCTAHMISQLGDFLMKQRKVLTSALAREELLAIMDEDGNGTVDEIEFLTFELVRKGICQVQDIHDLRATFKRLDTTGVGELDVRDIRAFAAAQDLQAS